MGPKHTAMCVRYLLFLSFVPFLLFSCNNTNNERSDFMEMEFILVDSLVFDEMQILRILDYSPKHGMYLMVNQGLEGKYFLIHEKGEILEEKVLSEGPDAFGMLLHRAGFIGDEILFVSEGNIFIYDLDLRLRRKYPFEQDIRFRLAHFTRDYLSTFQIGNNVWAVANLSDAYLQPYPGDYYDTLNVIHLINPEDGGVIKGGKLDESSKLVHGRFFPFMDKPVFFADPGSTSISAIFSGDSILYQYDPQQAFQMVNKIKIDRIQPDQIIDIPMSEASYQSVREYRSKNHALGGSFFNMIGEGEEFILAYRTGVDPGIYKEEPNPQEQAAISASLKTYYYPIKEGKQIGNPILWDKPGNLILGLGNNRYLQYADQADIHDTEKDYQCYYIFELRERDN